MAYAYTPGLKVSRSVILEKVRKLPLPGQVIVEVGQRVSAETIVARTELPGHVRSVNVAGILGIQPSEIYQYMTKREGEQVKKDEVIASTKGIFGFFKTSALSPTDGKVENISNITGQVMVREPNIPVEVNAYVDGDVIEVLPNTGVVVRTECAFIQGIFGIGGESIGQLAVIPANPAEQIGTSDIDQTLSGKIIVVGPLATAELVDKAISVGAKGIVAGGIDDIDLKKILGYDLGVAITGSENIGITIIITEGFGKMEISTRTFEILKEFDGRKASINGATQIRAGVIRPEVIIPIESIDQSLLEENDPNSQLRIGSEVRIIREPYFGQLAEVVDLPIEPQPLETEAKVRVLKVRIKNMSKEVTLPRANVEVI